MGSLHDLALAALRQALMTRTDALLRTLDTVFAERSLQAALQARRQLTELRAAARFLDDRALQRECVELQRRLLADGRLVTQGVPEPQARGLLRLALQIRWQAGTLAQPAPWPDTRSQRAAQLAPDLPQVLLRQVRARLSQHAGLGTVAQSESWQALRGAALLAEVLPASVQLATNEVQALLRWEQDMLMPGQSPSALLLQRLATRLQALCEEAGASAALRQSLATERGPLAERTLHFLQQAVVLLPEFTQVSAALLRALLQTLRLARLLETWQSVPSLTATSLPAMARPVLLRMLLRLQDDLARAASGNSVACAGLLPAQLEAAMRRCLHQQRPLAVTHILESTLGAACLQHLATAPALLSLAQQERTAAAHWLGHWQQTCAEHPGLHPLPDAADLAVTRLTQQALLTGDLALHELLVLLGHCFTRSRELQRDARDWLAVLALVLPFVEDATRQWQRQRVLRRLLQLEARLRVQTSASAADVALSLARGLRVLPGFSVPEFLKEGASPQVNGVLNRQVLMELRMLASGARTLQVQRIAALSGALAQVHEVLAQVPESPSRFLESTGGTALLVQAHGDLRRGLNQAAARQETSESRALLGALYDWLARHGEQAAGRAGFVQEAQALMQQIVRAGSDHQRLHALHTLKGNAALYRCEPIVQLCHRSERNLLHAAQAAHLDGASADTGVREPAALPPLLSQLQRAVARLSVDDPVAADSVGAGLVGAGLVGAGPAREQALSRIAAPEGAGPARERPPTALPPPHELPYCRLLATRLRSGLQSMLDLLQSVDTAPDAGRLHLARELLQEQLAQAAQLEEDLLASPRVHLARLSPRLRRVLEDTANRQGKSARLEICDAGRSVNRVLLEKLVAPLEHLLRNAVVHGIESPAQRRSLGKPACGRVRVLLEGDDGPWRLGVEDDGQGLVVTERLFQTGYSTCRRAQVHAGHGLGLAAVKAGIEALGGCVSVSSTPGTGTCFWLQMPENSGLGDNRAMPL
jgi:signal transduction histidine kinase